MSTDSSAPRVAPAWRAPLVVIAIGSIAWWALPDQLGLLTRIALNTSSASTNVSPRTPGPMIDTSPAAGCRAA